MTAYFAEIERRVTALPTRKRDTWLNAVALIERYMIHDVVRLMADEEFREPWRTRIEQLLERHGVGSASASAAAWRARKSVLARELREFFREFGAAGHAARFGVWSACPFDNLIRRDAHDRRKLRPVAAATPAPSANGDLATKLAALRDSLKTHDDRTSPLYDEDHARKLRAEIQALERQQQHP